MFKCGLLFSTEEIKTYIPGAKYQPYLVNASDKSYMAQVGILQAVHFGPRLTIANN
jgi:hypothetical protein